jgi:hypothetical protein
VPLRFLQDHRAGGVRNGPAEVITFDKEVVV